MIEPELDYEEAARVTYLWLKPWCDETLRFPDMVAEACRRVKKDFDKLLAASREMEKAIEKLRGYEVPGELFDTSGSFRNTLKEMGLEENI